MSTHRVESRAPLIVFNIDASDHSHRMTPRTSGPHGAPGSFATSVSNMNCALLRRIRRRRRRRPPRHAGAIAGLVLGVRRESALC